MNEYSAHSAIYQNILSNNVGLICVNKENVGFLHLSPSTLLNKIFPISMVKRSIQLKKRMQRAAKSRSREFMTKKKGNKKQKKLHLDRTTAWWK